MNYLTRSEINTEKWDACVANSSKPLIYGVSWYLDAATEGKWDGLVWGDYEAVMPLPWNRKLILKQLYTPHPCQQLGPFSKFPLSKKDLAALQKELASRFIKVHAAISIPYKDWKSRSNLILPLNQPYSEIKENFAYKRRRYDKKKYQNFTRQSIKSKDFMSFYRKNAKAFISDEKTFHRIERVINTCISRNAAFCWGASHNNILQSSVLITKFCNRFTLLFSATTKKGYQSRANSYLLFELIKEYSGKDAIFDFEGSEIPGVRNFFLSFGAKEEPYYLYESEKPLLKPIYSLAKKGKKLLP